jgi:hypothetical protein
MGDEECQAKQERLENLHLLDGLLARGRQDSQCAPGERREDGCRGSPPEGRGEKGGGAGEAGLIIEIQPVHCAILVPTHILLR